MSHDCFSSENEYFLKTKISYRNLQIEKSAIYALINGEQK